MKRALSLALILSSAFFIYACSDSKGDDPGTPVLESGTGQETSKPGDDGGLPDGTIDPDSSNPNTNPIEGIGAPAAIATFAGLYAEGPVWRGTSLYFSEYKSPGGVLIKFTPPSAVDNTFRTLVTNDLILGTTFDEKNNSFVTCQAANDAVSGGSLVRTPLAGGVPSTVALSFDGGVNAFDSPNDIVARKSDGTLYVTDPGYQKQQAGGAIATNHIWRVSPAGGVFELALDGRPNGIALSPDDKTLYVSFTEPAALPPEILKFPVNVDGSLGTVAPFAKVPPNDSALDGIAVDSNGNVYGAVKDGIEVFKPDGSKWGKIAMTLPMNNLVSGLAFGGADKKTLFITTTTGVYQVAVKVAGLAQ